MKSDAEPDDEELVILLLDAKDDRDRNRIFAWIVERHGLKIFWGLKVAFRGRFETEDIEELVQDSFLEVAKSIRQFDEKKGSFKKWLRGIAWKRALMELRKRDTVKRGGDATTVSFSETEDGDAPPGPVVEDDPARRLEEDEGALALLKVIEKLPRLQRDIVRSLMQSTRPDWVDDRAVDEELAKLHNTTLGTIRTERSKALSTLRDALIEGGWRGRS